ncbi:hypothetical protein PV11_06051 [Exophiala sideris]|uniref:Xylanolytic transcriptional activator regulatory domain-containing protein n=1 Tax=Exophiala sideris TaxID=1016849 RepID=A0A0D1YMI0_9EURO|nr:hypothetical protein PV11_06051 [Exophiala sideris]
MQTSQHETEQQDNSNDASFALNLGQSPSTNYPLDPLSRAPVSISSNKEGSEMLFARLVDSSRFAPNDEDVRDGNKTVYLVEPYNLTYVVRESSGYDSVQPQNVGKMHYTIPETMQERAKNILFEGQDNVGMLKEKELLNDIGALSTPKGSLHDKLLHTYFSCVHPAFPILDKDDFLSSVQRGNMSTLLLQAVYSAAATHCESSLLSEAGFPTRHAARLAFYKRAKALYDADYESNTVTVVQALILMCFWWGGPLDQKDTRHWLLAAIGLAQTMGMHRSTVRSNMSSRKRKLWKRIWWSLFIRDRHIAAALGCPMHIQEADCDVEMLQEADFSDDQSRDASYDLSARSHGLYMMQMTELSIVLGHIIKAAFAPTKSSTLEADTSRVEQELAQWEAQLPSEMKYQELNSRLGTEWWSNMLHLAYNNYIILLHRPRFAKSASSASSASAALAISAATKITRMTEDLVATGSLGLVQTHVVASIFSALSIHVMSIRRSAQGSAKDLAVHRARICMLALQELQEAWPFAGWVHQMFVRIMEDLEGDHIKVGAKQVSQPSTLDKYNEHDDRPSGATSQTAVDETALLREHRSTLRPLTENNECNVFDMAVTEESQFLGGEHQLAPDLSYEDFDMGPFGLDFPAQLTFWNDLSTMDP